MIALDYICNSCGFVEEKWQKFYYEKKYMCLECGKGTMERAFLKAPTFELKYNNKSDMCDWKGNTSRYWDEYKKQKKAGLDVRVPESDGDGRI